MPTMSRFKVHGLYALVLDHRTACLCFKMTHTTADSHNSRMLISFRKLCFTKQSKLKHLACCFSTGDKGISSILESYYQNGLTNYSSKENKTIIQELHQKFPEIETQRIKRWIDRRKWKEKQKNAQVNIVPRVSNLQLKSPGDITPLKIERWEHYLNTCSLNDKDWLTDGIKNGFSIDSDSLDLKSAKKNLLSAYSHPDVINQYLEEELRTGNMAGPYHKPPYESYQINRFGVIPKPNNKWRLIIDLSFPNGFSVNDGISRENFAVSYIGLTAAIEKILKYGKSCLMAKFDLKRAYRLLAIKPEDRCLLIVKWNGFYYVDLCLPFGLRSAPRIFTRFSDILEWILKYHGQIDDIQHSLDDFFICGPPGSSLCYEKLQKAFEICNDLGVEIEHSKTAGPSTSILFLGLTIDTEKMEISIPDSKLSKICILIEEWITKKAGSKRSLLSLIGSLYYCCQVVTNGRVFLPSLVKRAYTVDQLHHTVKLSSKETNDLTWWYYLLHSWNGRSLLSDLHAKNSVKLHS